MKNWLAYFVVALSLLGFCSAVSAHDDCKTHAKHYTVTKCHPDVPPGCHIHTCPCCRGIIIHKPHCLPRFRGCHTHTFWRLKHNHYHQHCCLHLWCDGKCHDEKGHPEKKKKHKKCEE